MKSRLISLHTPLAILISAGLISGCNWVDSTGRQSNSKPTIILDDGTPEDGFTLTLNEQATAQVDPSAGSDDDADVFDLTCICPVRAGETCSFAQAEDRSDGGLCTEISRSEASCAASTGDLYNASTLSGAEVRQKLRREILGHGHRHAHHSVAQRVSDGGTASSISPKRPKAAASRPSAARAATLRRRR